jgi:hypothetical protein
MTKKFHSTITDMSENELMNFAGAFYEEVASNVYLVKKNRLKSSTNRYVDGSVIADELNRTDSRVAVKTAGGQLLANFNRTMYRKFFADTLYREIT